MKIKRQASGRINPVKGSHKTCHHDQMPALRKIEGQVRGVQRMIDEHRYCVDILMQLHAVVGAIRRVHKNILKSHLDSCVQTAFKSGSRKESRKKIEEIFKILREYDK